MKVGELLPGTVVQVVDKEKGIVKCTAPSMFSVDDDPEVLPPIIPFAPSGHLGSVSTPEEGDLVWIVVDNSNSQMIYYIRRYAIPDELSNIDSPREVFFVRNDENGLYQLYWSSGDGIRLMKDGSSIRITPAGDIDIIKEGMNRAISISADSICIGKESSEAGSVDTHAAYGERVEEALEEIYNIFTRMYAVTAPSPYTNPISNILTPQMLAPLSSKISKITSQDVKIV